MHILIAKRFSFKKGASLRVVYNVVAEQLKEISQKSFCAGADRLEQTRFLIEFSNILTF